ncbi:MAG: molybdenum cofactor guanylyltransferase [Verrucomicrobiae bacterium]|nr:molybdenum cofactor guanylyltransferase [Verrucomicrobiae bacterium]
MAAADPAPRPTAEAFILAGGRSSRMGRDKARLRLSGRSLVAWIRESCREARLAVRVIRRDAVPECGPVGGVVTGLRRARTEIVVFLACDQPLVPAAWLKRLARAARGRAAFTVDEEGWVGLPLALPVATAPVVEAWWAAGGRSLQRLAAHLCARAIRPPVGMRRHLVNLNTPTALADVRRTLQRRVPDPGPGAAAAPDPPARTVATLSRAGRTASSRRPGM